MLRPVIALRVRAYSYLETRDYRRLLGVTLEIELLLSNVKIALGDRPMRLEFRPDENKWSLTWIRRGRAMIGQSCWYPSHETDSLADALEHVLLVENLNAPRHA